MFLQPKEFTKLQDNTFNMKCGSRLHCSQKYKNSCTCLFLNLHYTNLYSKWAWLTLMLFEINKLCLQVNTCLLIIIFIFFVQVLFSQRIVNMMHAWECVKTLPVTDFKMVFKTDPCH